MVSKADARRRKRRAKAQAQAKGERRTAGRHIAHDELHGLAERHPHLLAVEDVHADEGEYRARVRVATRDITRASSGMPISADHEDIDLWFGDNYPNFPPTALVRHDRFAGYPHVLVGRILCVYLDLDREWHPALGVEGAVDRLIEWLRDAAADRFDSRTALFHPIGGLPPSPRVAGTLVVGRSVPPTSGLSIARATVDVRTERRSDLVRWAARTHDDPPSATSALVLRSTRPIAHGLRQVGTLGELVARVEHAGGPSAAAALEAAARISPYLADDVLRVVLEVAHPADPSLSYLACAVGPLPRTSALMPNLADELRTLPIGWITVSDERTEVATRRDSERPTAAFRGKSIELWGCGGLGSWMAEFVVRAGASRIVLRDNGGVLGGLLVRQNYVEDDIGAAKADRLAARLRSLADDVEVVAAPSSALDVLAETFIPSTDLLIDATINVTVAARLDEWTRGAPTHPLIAQVATDPRSATLGMMVVASADSDVGPASIDDATWDVVSADPALERFHGFWTPLAKADQLVPALGCSTPTFHGSAADLACLAGSLVSLLAGHIGISASGTHLVESSHARGPTTGGHWFVPFASS